MHLFRWPIRNHWMFAAVCSTGFSLVAGSLGLVLGVFTWAPNLWSADTLKVAVIALVLPALMEELLFRGPLVWVQEKRGRVPVWLILASLVAFIAWHPINAFTFMPQAAPVFLDPGFLVMAAMLGAMASWLAIATRSLWPPIVFHWLIVVGWKAFLGAPRFL